MKKISMAMLLAAAPALAGAQYAGLYITEVISTPTENELIEICNTTGSIIDVSGVIVADEDNNNTEGAVKFPAATTLAPGEVVIIAVNTSALEPTWLDSLPAGVRVFHDPARSPAAWTAANGNSITAMADFAVAGGGTSGSISLGGTSDNATLYIPSGTFTASVGISNTAHCIDGMNYGAVPYAPIAASTVEVATPAEAASGNSLQRNGAIANASSVVRFTSATANSSTIGIFSLASNLAPALVNRVVSPATATSASAITVSVDVTDSDGTISSVNLFRRVNGGGYTSTAMVLGAAPTYSLNLGTFADTDLVEYYIEATDDDSAIGTLGTSSSPFPLFVNNNRPAVGEIAITEIMFGPLTTAPYSQANAEFVEVRNLTGTPKNISYFLLDDSSVRNVAVPFGTIIAANGYVIFANPAATYTTYTPWTTSSGAAPVVNYTFGLGGTGDSFVVKNDASAVIDSVAYLNGTGGWPAVNDTGSSVILVGDPAVVDNTLPANWRASGLDGTPGAPNVDDITVPAVASIVRADANPTVATSVNFTVTFSEPVKNVGVADFAVNATGATGTIDAVSFVNPTTFTVSLSGVGGSGTLGLDIAGAQDVVDFPNNALSSTEPSTDESYNVGASSVAGWQLLND